MPNLLTYTEIWTTALDQQAAQAATSGWMEANAGQVIYNGGKKIKIPTLSMSGLGDYTRGTGAANRGKYAQGTVELTYEDYTLEMDRSAEFAFDRHDVDETGFIIQAPTVMAEFQRVHVVPEMDAYRYSRIASLVMAQGAAAYTSQTLTTSNVVDEFLRQVREMQNVTGIDTGNLVATMPFTVYSILERSAEMQKQISVQAFERGGVSFEVKSINGIPLVPVVESRMMTEYVFHDGTTEMGFEPAAGAKAINWIITPRNLPIAISKTDNLKVFTPEQNQNGDDWLIQYRKYHDLWIKANQLNQIVLSIQP